MCVWWPVDNLSHVGMFCNPLPRAASCRAAFVSCRIVRNHVPLSRVAPPRGVSLVASRQVSVSSPAPPFSLNFGQSRRVHFSVLFLSPVLVVVTHPCCIQQQPTQAKKVTDVETTLGRTLLFQKKKLKGHVQTRSLCECRFACGRKLPPFRHEEAIDNVLGSFHAGWAVERGVKEVTIARTRRLPIVCVGRSAARQPPLGTSSELKWLVSARL